MGINRKIIKQQNLAAKGGKYISKGEALERIKKTEDEEKNNLLTGKN